MSINSNSVVNTKYFDSGMVGTHVVSPTSTSVVVANDKALDTSTTDQQWMVKQMMAKPIIMGTISWTTSQAAGFNNATYPIPRYMLSINKTCPAYRIWKSYTFFRGNFHFKFMVNATKFHVGRLIAAWVPLNVNPAEVNQFTLSGYPHVFIDAANSDAVELAVPFFLPTTAINTLSNSSDVFFDAGYLIILVLNQLSATTSVSATVDMTIYSWFDDAELRIPIDSGLVPDPSLYNEVQMGLLDDVGSFFGVKSTGKVMDSVESIGSSVGELFSGNFEKAAGDFGSALKNTKEFVADNPELAVMLFDRPVSLKTEICSKKMTFSSLCFGKGSDTVGRLDLLPQAMHIPNASVMAGHVSESNILELVRKPMLFNQITWSDGSTVGALLTKGSVCPTWFSHVFTAPFGQPTYLSGISDMFVYWRGKIMIRIDIVASQFHSGRLAFCYMPEVKITDSDPTMTTAMSSPTVIIDLDNTANRSFEIEMPFISNRPWLGTSSPNDNELEKSSCGTWYVFVLNQLVHPDNVPTSIVFNLYAYAGDDFALAFPSVPFNQTDDFAIQIQAVPDLAPAISSEDKELNETQADDGDDGDVKPLDESPEDSAALVVSNTTLAPDFKHFFNEFTGDLRDVIRRYGLAYPPFVMSTVPGTTAKAFSLSLPVTPISYGIASYSQLAYFSRMFAGWSGSLRYKILFANSQVNCVRMCAVFDPELFVNTPTWTSTAAENFSLTSGMYAIKVNNLTDEHGFEVEVPYASPFHFLPLRISAETVQLQQFTNGTLNLCFTLPFAAEFSEKIEVAIYVAAGDDFNFHFPISIFPRNVE